MLRAIAAAIVGYALWTALWFAGNIAFFAEAAEAVGNGERYDKPGPLVAVIVLSIVCSIAAGASAGFIGGRCGRGRVMALIVGVLLLLTGIGVQASAWDLMPVWYHLTFLVLLLPVTFGAGLIVTRPKPRT